METEEYVRRWIMGEREYTIRKFGLGLDDEHVQAFSDNEYDNDWWVKQFENYLGRAWILKLDTVNGRQALAKFVATGVGMLEAAVRVYGPLPEPGVTSGENLDKPFIL